MTRFSKFETEVASVKLVAVFVVFASALSPAASFAVAPAPPLGPPPGLHELARLDVPVCGRLVVHANSAIAGILHDDAAIRLAVTRLRSIDVEGPNPIARRAALLDLERLGADTTDRARSVEGELKRLRDTIPGGSGTSGATGATAISNGDPNAASGDPGSGEPAAPAPIASAVPSAEPLNAAHPADLRAFLEALSDAVGRQRRIASDLSAFTANLENREMRDDATTDDGPGGRPTNANSSVFGTAAHQSAAIFDSAKVSAREMALGAAGDFETRLGDVKRDEARAAEFSEAAVAGCD